MKILLISAFWLMPFFAKAQFSSVPMTINTPMGPVHTTQQTYMPYQNYQIGSSMPKIKFTAQFLDSSKATFRSHVLSEEKKMYVIYKNKEKKKIKIFPSDTKSLTAESVNLGISKGIVTDSCWLFPLEKGAITRYSTIPYTDIATIAIQKGANGEIRSLTKDHLKEMVSDATDKKIEKWLEKGELLKVIQHYNELKSGRRY